MGLIRVALKSSVIGGAIFYTVQEGLWSNSEDSARLYNRMYNAVAPYVMENVPKTAIDELAKIPNPSDISFFVKSNWNKGVMASMEFLVDLPTHTCNLYDSLMNQPAVKKLFESGTEPVEKSH